MVPPEAGFLVWLYKDFSDFTYAADKIDAFVETLAKTLKIENWHLDFNTLRGYIKEQEPVDYAQLIDCIYRYYSIYNLKKNVELFGDKNNFYLNEIDLLHRLYPSAKFIHIIRDGRSVAVSYMELNQKVIDSKYAPHLSSDIETIAREWMNNIETIEAAFKAIDPALHYTVRFKDLVEEPENTLKAISNFLNVGYQDEMLNYYKTTEDDGLEPGDFLQWKSKNLMPLQKDEANKYMKLSFDELNKFEQIAKKILTKYNFL